MATAKKRSKRITATSSKTVRSKAGKTAKNTKKAAPKKASAAKAGKKASKSTSAASKKASGKKAASKKASGKKASGKKAASKKASSTAKARAGSKKDDKKTTAAKTTTGLRSKASAAKARSRSGVAANTKASSQKAAAKKTSGKKSAAKTARATTASRRRRQTASRPATGDAALFAALSEGERAQALRVLTEDQRLSNMATVGRYRVTSAEPMVMKPPHELADHRLARIVIYDYASERSVDACVDLDTNAVASLRLARTQPLLSSDEEASAIAIALADDALKSRLSLGDEAQAALYYWSNKGTSLAYSRRSAAVLFGQPDSGPALVAVVDLLDNLVCEIVPAAEW